MILAELEIKEVTSLTQLFYTILAAVGVQIISGVAAWYQSRKNGNHLQEMRISLDGRLRELLEITRLEAQAKGIAIGAAGELARSEVEREHSNERIRLEREDQAKQREEHHAQPPDN